MDEFIVQKKPGVDIDNEEEENYQPLADYGPHIDQTHIQYAQEIFGNFDDVIQNPKVEQRRVRLEEIYEPIEIKYKYVTEHDKTIKETDIPERMQLFLEPFLDPSPEELHEEIEWICK